jgi:DNA polymerase-1
MEGLKMLEGTQLHLVDNWEDATKFMDWVAGLNTERIAFDTEGEGLNVRKDKVRLIQFGDRNQGWALPVDRWLGLATEVFDRWAASGRRFVGHNARYDSGMLKKHGINIPTHLIDDTMMLAAVADPSVPMGLKSQSARHIDPRAAALQSQLDILMSSSGKTWRNIPITASGPFATYWIYGALDAIITYRLFEHHAPDVLVNAPKSYDLELSTGWLASRMEAAGLLCDREYTSQQQSEFMLMYDDLTSRIRAEYGVDAGSKDQVVSVLQHDGVRLTKRTPGGEFSLDKDVLASVRHPIIDMISQRRKLEKLSSTYLRRFMEASEEDGRIRASINTIGGSGKSVGESGGMFGVRTGRMSLASPNLQQLPRGGDPLSSVIRNCIVSGEGKTLLMADFDQVELRIMAHLSRDPGLAEAFRSEGDFFTKLTQGIYHDPSIDKKDKRRQLTKSYVYATLYGAGNDKLATTTGVPLAEVEQLSRDFAASYSGVPAFQQAVQRKARERGQSEGVYYTKSPLTNRKFIGEQGKEYKLVNFTIQGMAAEILKMKLLELDAAGLGDYLRLPIHDEILLEVPDEDLNDAACTLRDVMNDSEMLSVPLTSGLDAAKRWGDKSPYNIEG